MTLFVLIRGVNTVNINCTKKVERAKKECHLMSNGDKIVLKISSKNLKVLENMFLDNKNR